MLLGYVDVMAPVRDTLTDTCYVTMATVAVAAKSMVPGNW